MMSNISKTVRWIRSVLVANSNALLLL